jgi:hemerythrin-like domain-containing protein
MQATDILMDEHRVIEGVLDALQSAAEAASHGADIRPGFFLDAADFIRNFADGCHHRKEEGVLFTAMAAGGLPTNNGPIAAMLADHEQGRQYTRTMRAAAERWDQGEALAELETAEHALGYVALLRQHIMKEDNILFPMAARVIPPDQQDRVTEDFEHVEHEETGAGVHEKYLALAGRLAAEAALPV